MPALRRSVHIYDVYTDRLLAARSACAPKALAANLRWTGGCCCGVPKWPVVGALFFSPLFSVFRFHYPFLFFFLIFSFFSSFSSFSFMNFLLFLVFFPQAQMPSHADRCHARGARRGRKQRPPKTSLGPVSSPMGRALASSWGGCAYSEPVGPESSGVTQNVVSGGGEAFSRSRAFLSVPASRHHPPRPLASPARSPALVPAGLH